MVGWFNFIKNAARRGAKVNCGNAAREGALGYDSAHRI